MADKARMLGNKMKCTPLRNEGLAHAVAYPAMEVLLLPSVTGFCRASRRLRVSAAVSE